MKQNPALLKNRVAVAAPPEGIVISHPSGPLLPALIAGAGERAAWRFLEFFTVNIRNKNTRAAIGRTGKLSDRPMSRVDAVVHGAAANGGRDYMENGGDITIAQRMAGHANIKTTQVYDRPRMR